MTPPDADNNDQASGERSDSEQDQSAGTAGASHDADQIEDVVSAEGNQKNSALPPATSSPSGAADVGDGDKLGASDETLGFAHAADKVKK
ncbi:MAG: hypothetical protein GY924_00890, partial [Planctomycetaceae bacterium]|nr:hypothetical protein [Planctomycetaceae bacterium]